MQNYPDCDEQVRAIADKIWGADYSAGKLSITYGRGRVFNGVALKDVLSELKVTKDFDLNHKSVLWTHRTMDGMDIYFLTNQSNERIDIRPTFRVTGLKPQLWDAVTGEVRHLHYCTQTVSGTSVPMALEPGQSQFIVFTNHSADAVHTGYEFTSPLRKELITVGGPWAVVFDNPVIGVGQEQTFDTLSDWSKSDNEAIKYYSGTAEYSTEFTLDSIPAGKDIFINLGTVGVMAEVTVNGKFAGGTWMAPYVLNVTDLVTQGKNTLKIDVVNLWRNYLVKEKSLPADQQKTWMVVSDVQKDEPLQPSGLIGPVRLETIDRK